MYTCVTYTMLESAPHEYERIPFALSWIYANAQQQLHKLLLTYPEKPDVGLVVEKAECA